MELPNCWEIKGCGRHAGGAHISDLGECVASKFKLGRSCWAIAGTLCGGTVQGSVAQKERNCMKCSVYADYNRLTGSKGKLVVELHPDEQDRYLQHLRARHTN